VLFQGHRFLHVTNWKKAEELVKAGKVKQEKGMYFIPMEQAIAEGLLFLVPEPKSPHGVDVTPDGKFIIVAGKLDSHVSVYSFEKIMKAIEDGNFEGKDPYGVPIIPMQDALHTQVNLGLGPLHTQYDSKPCVAYTSLYVDSQVAKYDYCEGKVLDKLSIHYNIGHLMTMEGDTVNPQGKYLVALNKLSIDRQPVGPLHPQNHQLIDISGDKMQLIYDMPLPLGEPHYVAAIRPTSCKPAVRYKSGWNSRTDEKHPNRHPRRPRDDRADLRCRRQVHRSRHGYRDSLAHHPRDHRGGGRRPGPSAPDQPRARPGPGARLRALRAKREPLDRARQDRVVQLRGR
jgi:nitrous-oxide reductase